MEPFAHHVFVCTQPKPEGVTSCPAHGAWSVLAKMERELLAQGLDNDVQLSTCGCLGLCDEGPILIVYPEGIWYRKVCEGDVPEIVSTHLRNGKIVDRLAWTDAAAMKAMSAEHRAHFRAVLKAREQAGILPDDLNETIRGFMPSRAILTALELDIFSAVGGGATVERVAQKIHADSRSAEMLLNVLVSLHLLEKSGDTFRNTPPAARFFSEGSPDNAHAALLHTANLWDRWSTLTDAVRAGTSVATRTRDQHGVASFIAAMDRNAKERAHAVIKAVAPNGVRRMLDLGGGSGAYSIAFAQADPDLHSEVMDLAEVIPITQGHVRRAALTDRVSTRVGDMLRDPLGERYDLILLSAICHMFSVEENRGLFERAYRALVPGGRFVVQDFILEPDKTSPHLAALFALNMLVSTRAGNSYSEPEYANWLHDAGFHEIRRIRLPGPASLMLAARP
ncbi:MAG TPA: methyltransferase [Verrucomicrobiae bacterium]|nr:methyltransferase [Verrucomicrobiae bacterium]